MRKVLAGRAPFEVVTGHLLQNETFRADIEALARIADGEIDAVVAALFRQGDFWDRGKVEAAVLEGVSDGDLRESVTKVIWGLGQMIRDPNQSVVENAADLFLAIQNDDGFADNEKERLRDYLTKLIVWAPALDHQAKAERLAVVTGKELEYVDFISDMRPVFDTERSRIVGFLPYTTLRLEIDDIGNRTSVELRMTEEQLEDLLNKVQVAKLKVDGMKSFAAFAGAPVPNVEGT